MSTIIKAEVPIVPERIYGSPISLPSRSPQAKLFRTRPVALLSDLRKALQTPSRTTVFRVLSSVGYLASYSHAGRYYTLKRIPQFDPRGLWHYRQIGFSSQRTLRSEEHTSELQSRSDSVC